MKVEARSSDIVSIEQVGGSKAMPGWLWCEAVSERDRLRETHDTMIRILKDLRDGYGCTPELWKRVDDVIAANS